MHTIDSIEGIGPVFKGKFNQAGIATVEDLLDKVRSPRGLSEVVEASGFNEETVKRWAGMADLFRVRGVSTQFSELLSACGVNSVKELASRNPKKLYRKMTEVNSNKKVCKSVPSLQTVQRFINQAKDLPKYHFT